MFSALPQLWVEVLTRGRGGEPSTLGIYLLLCPSRMFFFPISPRGLQGHGRRLISFRGDFPTLLALRRSFRVLQVTPFKRAPRCDKACIIWIAPSALQQSLRNFDQPSEVSLVVHLFPFHYSSLLVQLIADEGSKTGDLGDSGLLSGF